MVCGVESASNLNLVLRTEFRKIFAINSFELTKKAFFVVVHLLSIDSAV